MTDHYEAMKALPDPELAEELRQRLKAQMASGADDGVESRSGRDMGGTIVESRPDLVPVRDDDLSLHSSTGEGSHLWRRMAMAAAAVLVVIGTAGIAIRRLNSDDGHLSPTIASTVAPTDVPTTDVPTTGGASQLQQVEILGGPDWLAADDEGVWVKLNIGQVQLVDPGAATVVAEVAFDEPGDKLCQGIGTGFGSVWTCAGTDVVRIDAATRTVQSRLQLNKISAQGHLIAYADRIWVLTGTGDTLVGVDPSTEQVVTTISLPWRSSDVAAGAAGLWVISASDGYVMHVDADSGEVLADIPVADATAITVGDTVWVAAKSASFRIDPATGAIVTTLDAGSGPFGSIAADGESVWVRNTTDFLVEFDAQSGEIVRAHPVDATSGGDILLAFGSVWTTAFDDSLLVAVPID